MHGFRYILFKSSWLIRPDLGKILTTISSSFVIKIPFVYHHPKNTILVYGLLEDHLDIPKFRDSFLQLLESKDLKGNPIYPEMKMYIKNYCGFFFWKSVPDFSIENHVRIYDNSLLDALATEDLDLTELNSETVVRLAQNIIKRPFPVKQSPWEFLLYHNKIQENTPESDCVKKTMVAIRLHHSLADGYSLFNLVMKHAGANVEQAKPNFKRPRSLAYIIRTLLLPFWMPYEMISQFFHCYDSNAWHLPEKTMARDNCGVVTATLSTQFVKNIKTMHQASFAGVVLTALAGGIRKTMILNQVKLPEQIHCLTPLPLPNHPDKLRNHMTGCFVKLPLDAMDSHQRLKAVEKNLLKIRGSTVLQTNYLMNKVVGGTVSFISKRLWKPVICTTTLSSFPGPENEISYLGHRMLSSGFMGNVDVGNIGINMTMFSYNGNLDICLTVDRSILETKEQSRELMEHILSELHALTKDCVV
ncbi:unnamed protein product [Allacma fusca]|uniref:O-acyltransferase WSD1 C-terminal domain-containing protein n=1 Tax=Allacma fusca TaxID=39272 RepID=A0A8J2KEB7_9HEXA|nr:unnamed protein product [Allacma fusca]